MSQEINKLSALQEKQEAFKGFTTVPLVTSQT